MTRAARRTRSSSLVITALALVTFFGVPPLSGASFTSSTVNPGAGVTASPDWTPPSVGLNNPGPAVRGTVTLTAPASDAESGITKVTIAVAPRSSAAWSTVCNISAPPWSCPFATTSHADGLYDLQATATDGAGYSAATAVVGVRIDNTAPAGTVSLPAAPLAGSVVASATFTEAGSGLAAVELQRAPAGTTTWVSTPCTIAGQGATCTLDTTLAIDGTHDFRVRATDVAGNVGTSPVISREIRNRVSAVSMQATAAYVRGPVTLTATASSNVGITSVKVQRATTATGPWVDVCTMATAPFSCPVDSATMPNGSTWFRAVLVDGSGATTTSATVGPVTVDNNPVRAVDIQAVGTGNGLFGKNDVYLYTYSQPLQPSSIVPGWNGTGSQDVFVRVQDTSVNGYANDSMEVWTTSAMTTRVNVGTVDMGANLVGSLTKNMHFSGTLSLETVKVDGRDVTRVRLTVGDWLGQGVALVTFSNAQMTWYPSAATRDTWGIATATTTASESGSADNDI